ncbi:hypothetical protein SDRG_17378 [Saprolegnia diclina VS20]|uniref:Helicase C-terminal domain-containing protein n=1 Tax=Saprolegnia diclina (strain VS20) TaxID=1156394 RepID=T0PH85_SAPDV|nr:hypothetical protein SDRG_17378 [Saprolegnia diclina VS20]EQC24729.1 hypothetical protein SDRG_17378 [Saprolegnia diclina VS20]|eukprot:XP_008621842.1 hypothetical protein SDRG_17378 [Saprolegnia diclina VS20]
MAKSTKRPRESAPKSRGGSDFVVVNPSLLRGTEAPAPKKAKKDTTKKESKPDVKKPKSKSTESKPTKDAPKAKPSGVYHCDVCDLDVTMGAKAMHEQGKKHKRALVSSGPVTTPSDNADAPADGAKVAAASSAKVDVAKVAPAPTSVQYVHASRPEDFVGAVYALLDMHNLRRALVVVPNKGHALLQPQLVAGALKHLGFTALAVHAKTPATQRQQTLEKFRSSSSIVLVATEHLAKGLASPSAVYVNCTPSKPSGVLYVVLEKDAAPASDWAPVTPWNKLALQKASSRAAMAKTIHELTTQDVDNEAQWIQKLASASGLDADEMPKAKPSANRQKLAAVAEKLFLHMGYPLTYSGPIDVAGMKAKMTAVGLHVQSAATGMSLHATRLSAQTQWLDAASGGAFGGEWDGSVRHGASKDSTSLQVRAEFCAQKSTWQPNPKPADAAEWGGPYGKPCGHNEVLHSYAIPDVEL